MINREVKYERNLGGSYIKIPMAYQAEFDEKLMLQKNLSGLIGVEKCFYNDIGQYWYNITGLQSLETRVKWKSLDYHFVNKLLYKICEELRILEVNLMSPGMLLLEPEFIFLSNSSQEISFMLYPGIDTDIMAGIRELMEFILLNLDHSNSEEVQEIYGIYELILNEASTVADLKFNLEARRDKKLISEVEKEEEVEKESRPLIRKIEKPKSPKLDTNDSLERSSIVDKCQELLKKCMPNKLMGKKYKKEAKKKLSSYIVEPDEEVDNDIYIDKYTEKRQQKMDTFQTVCITSQPPKAKGILKYEGDDFFEDIKIEECKTKEVRIGKGREVEVQISDETISRIHARITKEEDGYYLEDLNSTNGTYVNEDMLPFRTKRKLNRDDRVRFAEILYRFV